MQSQCHHGARCASVRERLEAGSVLASGAAYTWVEPKLEMLETVEWQLIHWHSLRKHSTTHPYWINPREYYAPNIGENETHQNQRTEKLIFRWQLFLTVQSIAEVNAADTAVGMDLYTKRFDVVCAIGPAGEVRQIKLNLVPTLIQAHRHSANKRLYTRSRLVVGCSETTRNTLVVKHLYFKAEVLLQVLDDHHKEGQLYTKRLVWVIRARDVHSRHICAHYFKHTASDVPISDTLDVPIAHFFIPNLQRLAPYAVQN